MSAFQELLKGADLRVQQLQSSINLLEKHFEAVINKQNKFGLSFYVLHYLLENICLLVAAEAHRDAHSSTYSTCSTCGKKCFNFIEKIGLDIYGNKNDFDSGQSFACCNCGRLVAPSRFAPHLEKCMGMGRNSRKRGLAAKPETAQNEEDDSSDGKRKRKMKKAKRKKDDDEDDEIFSENEDFLNGSISNFVSFPDSDFVEIE